MEYQANILVIEDDEDIRMVEETYLQAEGYHTVSKPDGNNIEKVLQEEGPFDLVLLDLMLPGQSGYQICKEIRDRANIPILMVTALSETADKVRGLTAGADDYIVKPFEPMELVARVRANIRQYRRLSGPAWSAEEGKKSPADEEICVGNLHIFINSWRVIKDGKEIRLTNLEFMLLRFLAENANIVFSKEELLEKVWGYDYAGDSATVMVHINRLREKLEDDPKNPKILETVWGAGYRFRL